MHLSVFQGDDEKRAALMTAILAAGIELGGTISAEHGIGLAKRSYVRALEDPAKLALMTPHQGRLRPQRHPQPRQGLLVAVF